MNGDTLLLILLQRVGLSRQNSAEIIAYANLYKSL